jgi:glycosyltransferase involved in cell wall biosynthesis
MKILISSDGTHAHYFQRLAWANAFNSIGFQAVLWDCKKTNAFDAFDSFEPDIFMGQAYNLDDALIKCIYERPHLRVALRAGDWGDHGVEVDKSKYNILYCSDREKKILEKLKKETGKPDFVHIHYNQKAVEKTHNHFNSIGIKPVSLMMCADTVVYGNARFDPRLECDIGFVGGYWPHKGIIINKYLFPLLGDVGEYKVKIFGNQPWPVNQYCGLIQDEDVKNLFLSASICPNLSEPHAHEFGIDVNERIFKILISGGFCISDNVKSYEMFEDGIVIAESPKDFKDKIDFYLKNPEEREQIKQKGHIIVRDNHTGFHRVSEIMKNLGYTDIADKIINAYKESIDAKN